MLLTGPLVAAASASDSAQEAVDSANSMWENFVGVLPRLGVAVVVFAIGWLISRGIRAVGHRVLSRSHAPSFASVMSKLMGWVVLFVVFLASMVVAFPSVQPVDMLAGLGFFSVAIGFAFQDIFENTLSGVLLLFREPFRVGDQVEVQGQTGTVRRITIRETQIDTFDGELILIPNRDVYKSIVRVQTESEAHRASFVVGIAYENDSQQAVDVMQSELSKVPGVLASPPPLALVRELNVSTVDIECRFWCRSTQADTLQALSAAIVHVKAAMDEHGIEMPADIVALQATPSFKAALQNEAEVTPGGAVIP